VAAETISAAGAPVQQRDGDDEDDSREEVRLVVGDAGDGRAPAEHARCDRRDDRPGTRDAGEQPDDAGDGRPRGVEDRCVHEVRERDVADDLPRDQVDPNALERELERTDCEAVRGQVDEQPWRPARRAVATARSIPAGSISVAGPQTPPK